jgi:hypothetical protein
LLGMQERVELAGGHFEIRSTAGRGTEIHVRFSLPQRSTEALQPPVPSPTIPGMVPHHDQVNRTT